MTTYKISGDKVELYHDGEMVAEVSACLLQDAARVTNGLAEDAMRKWFGWERYEGRLSLPTPADAADALLVARDELLEAGVLRMTTPEEDRAAADRAADELAAEFGW